MNKSGVFILYFIFIPINTLCFTLRNRYIYEFGYDKGNIIYTHDGNIDPLTSLTKIDIPILPNYDVTYIKVTVNSISPPKVDYLPSEHRVTIACSWSQIISSSYSITVKAVPRSKAIKKHKHKVVKQVIVHCDGNKKCF